MMKKHADFIRVWANKIRAIKKLGGKCTVCNNSNVFHMVFHHNKDKKMNFSNIRGSRWSVILKEISKCKLMCANCHQEFHFKEDTVRSDLKIKLIKIKGDIKCSRCGYVGENVASLDFHHVKKKNFCIGKACRGNKVSETIDKIIDEINKCIVMCRNCHMEESINKDAFLKFKKQIYYKVNNFKEKKIINKEDVLRLNDEGLPNKKICDILDCSKSTISTILKNNKRSACIEQKKSFLLKCCYCEKGFEVNRESDLNQKYCSLICKGKSERKLQIGKKELCNMLIRNTYSSIAREYGVVPNTVRNLAKRYGII